MDEETPEGIQMTATPKDLQDEVGRLRDEIAHMRKALVGIYNRLPIVRTTEPIVVSGLLYDIGEMAWRGICPPKETPPESADELLSKSNNAALLPIDNKPQACEHEWEGATLFDTDNTETRGIHCVKCLKFVAPNSPQEPKEGERDG